jgi:hypothetical protein
VNGSSSEDDGGNGRSLSDEVPSKPERGRGVGRTTDDGLLGAGATDQELVGASPTGRAPQKESVEFSPVFRSWSDPATSANTPERCHFLRTISPDGRLGNPLLEPALTHRCAAFGEPLPLSLRQQELVCLQRVHVSCPRYLRGALLASETAPEPQSSREQPRLSRFTLIGLLLLAVSFALGVALMTGILPIPKGGSTQAPVAVATASPTADPSPTGLPSETPTATATSSPTPSVSASPSATPSPVPTPTPTPEVWPTCPAGANADRYVCLKPCQDEANCYVYLIRDVRETVKNLASYFGVTRVAIREMNPWLGTSGEPKPGQTVRIPPPTLP